MAFSKLPKHRTFNYKPRFYDPKKEELDRIVSNAKKQAGLEQDDYEAMKSRIRSGFTRKTGKKAAPRKAVIKSNLRIFFIIVFLLLLVMLILNSNISTIIELAN